MKLFIRCIPVIALFCLLCGCDYMKSDEPPPYPKATHNPQEDYNTAVKLYNEGMALFAKAKIAPKGEKWDLVESAMIKFRNSAYLMGHYTHNAPPPLKMKDVQYYYGQADAFYIKMKDYLRPGGTLPTPDSK